MSDPLGLFEDSTTQDPLGLFGEEPSPGIIGNVGGAIGATADYLGGLPAMIAGPIAGIGTLVASGGDIQGAKEVTTKTIGGGMPTSLLKKYAGVDLTQNPTYQGLMWPVEKAMEVGAYSAHGYYEMAKAAGLSEMAAKNIEEGLKLGTLSILGAKGAIHAFKAKPKVIIPEEVPKVNLESLKAELETPTISEAPKGKETSGGPADELSQLQLFDLGEQGKAPNLYEAVSGEWRLDEHGIPIRVDLSMEAANLEQPLQRNLWGEELLQKHPQEEPRSLTAAIDIMENPPWKGSPREEALSRLQGAVEAPAELKAAKLAAESLFPPPEEMKVPKGQRGGVLFDWSKKPEIEVIGKIKALKDVLPELTMVADTPEKVAEIAKTSADVPERSIAGKAIGQFTKGFLYEKFKTDNPILKYTYDTFSTAVDNATRKIDSLIRDQLTPTLRVLSDKEMADVGEALVLAMKNKKPLTPELMVKHGFNEKQIKASEILRSVHESNLTAINESRALVGKKPIEPYEAYIAGMATGSFKKVIYKHSTDKAPEVVGIVGSDFRNQMDRRVEALLKDHPEYSASEEKYSGIRKGQQQSTKALQEALSILSDNNPNYAEFAKALDDAMSSEGYKAMGAKKHTLSKKGIFGMEGDKPWQDSYENAKDLFNAQIRYTQTMSKWAEYSKAMDQVAKVFSDPEVQTKQPNALKMADSYIKNIMGQNPTEVGQAIDHLVGTVGEKLGVGPAILRHTLKLGRNTVNSLFFTLNHAWMLTNILQPYMVAPETKAFLRGRGVDVNLDPTALSDTILKGSYSSLKHKAGWPETPFEQRMWKAAKEYGVDQTQLIEAPNAIRGGAKYRLSQIMKFGANAVEADPRSIMFGTLSHILNEAGYGKDPNIFPVARQLTDMAMTDYRHHEQIKAVQQMGVLGEMGANLTSFKQNTLSRYALFAREMGQGNAGAFSTAMVAALVYAGVMGVPGFTELDWGVDHISKLMGKPTTLSKLTLDMADEVNKKYDKVGDILSMGVGASMGVDLHNRLGQPSIMPSLTGGFGKLVDIGKDIGEVATKTNEWNVKQLARTVAPPPLQPWMDTEWFTQTTPTGQQIALNKQGKGVMVRNEADVLFKKLGFTGVNEARIKGQDYALSQQDKYYSDQQKNIMEQLQEVMASNKGNVPESTLNALAKHYIEAQGDPNRFGDLAVKAGLDLNTTTRMRRLIAAQTGTLPATYKLQRSYTK